MTTPRPDELLFVLARRPKRWPAAAPWGHRKESPRKSHGAKSADTFSSLAYLRTLSAMLDHLGVPTATAWASDSAASAGAVGVKVTESL